jgi:hypothetical protein
VEIGRCPRWLIILRAGSNTCWKQKNKYYGRICTALDRQIGNMISFISLPEDDVAATAELARNADRFGLYIFYSGGIFDEGGGEIGFLEMYCCTARDPFVHELQLITRAICLATIALECEPKADHQANHRRREKGPARGNVLSWPAPMN